jgi:hypothetical protein
MSASISGFAADAIRAEAASRSVRMLRTAMGPAITSWLEDPAIDDLRETVPTAVPEVCDHLARSNAGDN